ncbi:MAG: nucleoside deaminase [Bacteroidetes bacterium]|nr:nucleoside deaminase [Bacteroidota bacterium]
MNFKTDKYYIGEAIKEANRALEQDEVPVGAIIVCNNTIIARAYNQVEQLKDSTAHAEMIAITSAMEYMGAKYLTGCSIYITIEPCPMCASATKHAQLGKLVFGARDIKQGFLTLNKVSGIKRKDHHPILHKKTKLIRGIMEDECTDLMVHFFSGKRS